MMKPERMPEAKTIYGVTYSVSSDPLVEHIKENFHCYSTVAIKEFLNRNCNKFAVALNDDEVIAVYNHNIYIVSKRADVRGVSSSVRDAIDDINTLFKAAPVLFGHVGAEKCTVVTNGMISVSAYAADDMQFVVDSYNYVHGVNEGDDDEWY